MNKQLSLIPLLLLVFFFSGCSDQPTSTDQATDIKQEIRAAKEAPIDSGYDSSRLSMASGSQPPAKESQPPQQQQQQPSLEEDSAAPKAEDLKKFTDKYDQAIIKTNQGDIKVKFFNADAPYTVGNFMKLANDKFYDGTKFHRVIKDFMIQGGDPNSIDSNWADDGVGGPGYKFKDEFNNHKLVKGSLAMANSGANTNGSQFFIVTKDATPSLDGKHTCFGEVVEGMDVAMKIEGVETNENDHPKEDVTIKTIELIEKKK